MALLRALGWIYALLYVVAGLVILGHGHIDVAAGLWLPFGLLLAAFGVALSSRTRVGRFVAAAVSSALTGISFVLAIWAPLALWDEHSEPGSGSGVRRLLLLATAVVVLSVLGAGTHSLYRALGGPARRRALVTALAVPSVAAVVSALSGAVCLPLTPPGFLYGLVAIFALSWAALAAAFLAGAWLAHFIARAAPPPPAPPPLPTARVR